MPFVRIESNRTLDAETSAVLVQSITDLVAKIKPEVERRGIAVTLHHGCVVAFDADAAPPAVVITMTNATMPHAVTLPLTQGLTALAKQYYGADPVRVYLFFHELTELHLVGIMGVTFEELQAPPPAVK